MFWQKATNCPIERATSMIPQKVDYSKTASTMPGGAEVDSQPESELNAFHPWSQPAAHERRMKYC